MSSNTGGTMSEECVTWHVVYMLLYVIRFRDISTRIAITTMKKLCLIKARNESQRVHLHRSSAWTIIRLQPPLFCNLFVIIFTFISWEPSNISPQKAILWQSLGTVKHASSEIKDRNIRFLIDAITSASAICNLLLAAIRGFVDKCY